MTRTSAGSSGYPGSREPGLAVRVSENVGAPMRDGTVLRGDVYRPRGSGPWPVLAYLTLPVCTGG